MANIGGGLLRDYPVLCNGQNCGQMSTQWAQMYDRYGSNKVQGPVSNEIRHHTKMELASNPSERDWGPANKVARDSKVSPISEYWETLWNPSYQNDYEEFYRAHIIAAIKGTKWEPYWLSSVFQFVCYPDGGFRSKIVLTDQLEFPEARLTVFRQGKDGPVHIIENWEEFAPWPNAGNTAPIPNWYEDLPKLTENADFRKVYPYFYHSYEPCADVREDYGLRYKELPTQPPNCLPPNPTYPPAYWKATPGSPQWPVGDDVDGVPVASLSAATTQEKSGPIGVYATLPSDIDGLYEEMTKGTPYAPPEY
jgi:hypothetical protein